jgi:xanthine/uracil/vitamin C permease (AzgA family)
VAGLGVQVLFGFLLSIPFTNRFVKLVSFVDRGATVALVAVFVVCLFAALWFVLPLARSRTRFPS